MRPCLRNGPMTYDSRTISADTGTRGSTRRWVRRPPPPADDLALVPERDAPDRHNHIARLDLERNQFVYLRDFDELRATTHVWSVTSFAVDGFLNFTGFVDLLGEEAVSQVLEPLCEGMA